MVEIARIQDEFKKHGGILRTSELNALGLSSRQINRLLDEDLLTKIKHGFYELSDVLTREEVIITRLFARAVIYLESALIHYEYTDRIPSAWQIAVDKDSEKSQYKMAYLKIEPYFIELKYLEVGIDYFEVDGVSVRIYDRDRTICDVLRYEKKLEKEVFNNAIKRYIQDPKKNIRKLFEYATVFNIKSKVQTYIGVWL